MDAVPVCCTRDVFNACAESLSLATAWEMRSRRSVFETAFTWLEATYKFAAATHFTDKSILITAYVVYNSDFRVPQLGFFASSLLTVEDLQTALPNLCFMNTICEGTSGDDYVSSRPLVSCTWNEEAAQHMWVVHPCDTENLLRRARYAGVQGTNLSVFLAAMSTYFPLDPSLIPPAS